MNEPPRPRPSPDPRHGRRDASPTGRRYRAGLPCREPPRIPLQTVVPARRPRRNSS